MRGVLLLAVALLLAACGSGEEDQAPGAPTGGPAGSDELVLALDRGDGSPAERWTLRCGDPVAGDHPDAAAACAHLAGLDDPFAPIPDDVACSQQYGGPQTATVTGRWRGQPVDLELSRVDGCRIAQWDALGPLLPG